MAEGKLSITDKILTTFTRDEREKLVNEFVEQFAEKAQEAIIKGFERSTQLSAYIGQYGDPEALRAITRSLKVEVIRGGILEAKFDDSLGHWYGGGDLPEELSSILQNIIDNSLNSWLRTLEASDLLTEVLSGPCQ